MRAPELPMVVGKKAGKKAGKRTSQRTGKKTSKKAGQEAAGRPGPVAELNDAEWSVYLVRCGDGSLYTGVATDVHRRFEEHVSGDGRGAKYLRGRGPLQLVLWQVVGERGAALRVEARVKRLSKQGKERLLIQRGLLEALAERDD